MMNRKAGILLPISSLPSRYGIGCFDEAAYKFVDWLKAAGQHYWQILPLVPTSYGDSPYQSFSTFAGNPYFIDLGKLVQAGFLAEKDIKAVDMGTNPADIDYAKLYKGRYKLLRKAYENSHISENHDFQQYIADNSWWLEDYALFMALKDRFDGKCWNEWPEDIRLRWGYSMDYYRRELYFDIEFQMFMQYHFARQWQELKAYANRNGVEIIGDIPIYVAMDSADTWSHPELFQLNEQCEPLAVAGCPPDGFSATGQLWGNPLYNWDYHRSTSFDWWMSRLWYAFNMYDVLRIDHFRGFDEYYSIPYGAKDAIRGHWEKGPGIDLFKCMKYCLGDRRVIAEDLGFMTDSVRQLVRESGFPNMKVLEFAFDSRDTGAAADYLPYNYNSNCVVYTGTHDNETLQGWFKSINEEEIKLVRDYLAAEKTPLKELHKPMIRAAMSSVAATCIIPMQDYLGLDNSARTNKPSTVGQNWRWRVDAKALTPALAKEIYKSAKIYGRA